MNIYYIIKFEILKKVPNPPRSGKKTHFEKEIPYRAVSKILFKWGRKCPTWGKTELLFYLSILL